MWARFWWLLVGGQCVGLPGRLGLECVRELELLRLDGVWDSELLRQLTLVEIVG